MKKLVPLLISLLIVSGLQAQNPDIKRTMHWYFGEYAGLDFSSGNPVAVTNSAMYVDAPGSASISDTNGNLLFYTDGKSVWNKNHQLMQNGTGLIAGAGSIQEVLIIPKPLFNSIYYIFHNWVSPAYTALRYSVVDMSLQAGMGDVTEKNDTVIYRDNPPSSGPCEKLAATMHKNGTDVWVMAKQFYTNNYFAFRVTSAGVDTVPVISSAGMPDLYGGSSMKFSPSGKKLAIAFTTDNTGNGFELLSFDNASGTVSNPIIFPNTYGSQHYGLEFSPDESKLYISKYAAGPSPYTAELYQIDLSSDDSATMVNSLTTIFQVDEAIKHYGFIQQASDGKLYVAVPFVQALGVIINPNEPGILCNYVDSGMYLAGKISGAGLPSFISNYFFDSTLETVISISNLQNEIICYPNPFNSTTNIIIPNSVTITDIEMFDVMGKKTDIKKKITNGNDKTIITLERGNLSAGIYFLIIKTTKKIYSQKIIITN